jgi:hypothetical protein
MLFQGGKVSQPTIVPLQIIKLPNKLPQGLRAAAYALRIGILKRVITLSEIAVRESCSEITIGQLHPSARFILVTPAGKTKVRHEQGPDMSPQLFNSVQAIPLDNC